MLSCWWWHKSENNPVIHLAHPHPQQSHERGHILEWFHWLCHDSVEFKLELRHLLADLPSTLPLTLNFLKVLFRLSGMNLARPLLETTSRYPLVVDYVMHYTEAEAPCKAAIKAIAVELFLFSRGIGICKGPAEDHECAYRVVTNVVTTSFEIELSCYYVRWITPHC